MKSLNSNNSQKISRFGASDSRGKIRKILAFISQPQPCTDIEFVLLDVIGKEDFLDAYSHQPMYYPVRLHGSSFDFQTLLSFLPDENGKRTNPLNDKEFTLDEVLPNFQLFNRLESIIRHRFRPTTLLTPTLEEYLDRRFSPPYFNIEFNRLNLTVDDEFADIISCSIMNLPVILDTRTYDYDNLERLIPDANGLRACPLTRIKFSLADLKPAWNLHQRITKVINSEVAARKQILLEMCIAAAEGNMDMLKILCSDNPKVSVNASLENDINPLFCACLYNQMDTAKYLLTKGVPADFHSWLIGEMANIRVLGSNLNFTMELLAYHKTYLLNRIKQQDTLACITYGRLLLQGAFMGQNISEGLRHLYLAGKYGNVDGFIDYADIYTMGLFGVKPNYSVANEFLIKSLAITNDPEIILTIKIKIACLHIVWKGTLDLHSIDIDIFSIQDRASSFNPEAQYLYSRIRSNQNKHETTLENSLIYSLYSISQNHVLSLIEFATNAIIKHRMVEAFECLNRAAEKHSTFAKQALDMLQEEMSQSDKIIVKRYCKLVAQSGMSQMQFILANHFLKGCLDIKYTKIVTDNLQAAAEQGYAFAQYRYAMLLIQSDISGYELMQAVNHLESASNAGLNEAQHECAMLHFRRNTPTSISRGLDLLEIAALCNFQPAINNYLYFLSQDLDFGQKPEKRMVEFVKIYHKQAFVKLKNYINLFENTFNSNEFERLKIPPREEFLDPVTGKVINIPVKVHGVSFDFSTLQISNFDDADFRMTPLLATYRLHNVEPDHILNDKIKAEIAREYLYRNKIYKSITNAASNGDLIKLQSLFNNNPTIDINDSDALKRVPILRACRYGHVECAKYLFEIGADLELRKPFYGLSAYTVLERKDNNSALLLKKHIISYLMQQIKAKHIPSIMRYAQMHLNGEILKFDAKKALQYFKMAANLGEIKGYLECAKLYRGLYGVQPNFNLSMQCYENALATSNDANIKDLIKLKQAIEDMCWDKTEYFRLLGSIHNLNVSKFDIGPEANYINAIFYRDGFSGYKYDISLYLKHLKIAVNNGCIAAIAEYAYLLIKGKYINKNIKLGLENLKKAADDGHLISQYLYAYLHYVGTDVEKNTIVAEKYFKMSADRGHAESQYNYSILCEENYGNNKLWDAKAYCTLAANQNMCRAHRRLQHLSSLIDEQIKQSFLKVSLILAITIVSAFTLNYLAMFLVHQWTLSIPLIPTPSPVPIIPEIEIIPFIDKVRAYFFSWPLIDQIAFSIGATTATGALSFALIKKTYENSYIICEKVKQSTPATITMSFNLISRVLEFVVNAITNKIEDNDLNGPRSDNKQENYEDNKDETADKLDAIEQRILSARKEAEKYISYKNTPSFQVEIDVREIEQPHEIDRLKPRFKMQ